MGSVKYFNTLDEKLDVPVKHRLQMWINHLNFCLIVLFVSIPPEL